MSEAGSQWWPPEAESENGRSSGAAQVRRPNPILTPDQRQPTPDVAAVLAKTARLVQSESSVVKVTVRLPRDLVTVLKAEAHSLTNHQRRGFSDLLAVCARHGLEAYQAGDLEIAVAPRVVERRIVVESD